MKTRFLFSILVEWPLMLLVSGLFTLASVIIVPLAIHFEPVWMRPSKAYPDGRRVASWPTRWLYPWGNDEDGIDGLPSRNGLVFKNFEWRDKTRTWSFARRVFTWCVLRNSASNLRFMPFVGYKINPSRLRLGFHNKYHGTESWYMWEGWRSSLFIRWSNGVHFWIGWPQKPDDLEDDVEQSLHPSDTRAPGVTFKLQVRR